MLEQVATKGDPAMIRLLILEPHDILRMGLSTVLSNDGEIEVVGFVGSVAEALQDLDRLNPHVLLLDECTDSNLISTADEAGVASIIFSSSSESKDVFEALTAGAKAYILKGTSITLLLAAIRAVGAGASWLDPGIAKRAMEVITTTYVSSRTTKPIKGAYGNLSEREAEVLYLLCDGLPNEGIAKSLFISRETVKTHVRHIMEKLQVRTRTEAAVQGIKLGLINDRRTSEELALSR